jgi:uncharacterized protein YbaA (DUF1428 family)
MSYITGFLAPVRSENKDRYVASAHAGWALFKEYGATAQVEGWGEDVADGETASFPKAVQLQDGEVAVFSWVIWPDKATADAAWATMESDQRMRELDMPFDGKRMIIGGFTPVFES